MGKPDFTPAERKVYRRLSTPAKIQDFLNGLAINFELNGETCWSPRMVLRYKEAQCLEGAIFAACALSQQGYKPLLVDLMALEPDQSHVIAVFQQRSYFGAIGKTNHAVLRFREPVYKTLRELVLSYFHEYFLDTGQKTLRTYSLPVNLSRFDKREWQTSEHQLWYIDQYLNKVKHYNILQPWQARQLRQADNIEIAAGKLVGWYPGPTKPKRVL
jgi:hypothetical protein